MTGTCKRKDIIMLYFIKFIYSTFILPPGIFIFVFLIVAVYLMRIKRKKIAVILLVADILLYILSTGLFSGALIHSLEAKYQFPIDTSGDVIIVLGGGAEADTTGVHGNGTLSSNASNRMLTALQLYKTTNLPIIVSGGQVFEDSGNEAQISRDILVSLGVDEKNIIMDNQSLNTEENAANCAKILRKKGFTKPLLVTSAFHMPRAVKFFTKNSIRVTAIPCDYQTTSKLTTTVWSFVPSSDGLRNTSTALKEYLGMIK